MFQTMLRRVFYAHYDYAVRSVLENIPSALSRGIQVMLQQAFPRPAHLKGVVQAIPKTPSDYLDLIFPDIHAPRLLDHPAPLAAGCRR